MRIHINPNDAIPIYKQVIKQLRYLIASGQMRPGDEMPPIRKLAQELLINPNTVARAYRDLEQEGLLQSRQGSGTVVADSGSPLSLEVRREILSERIDALLAEARQLKFTSEEIHVLIDERFAALTPQATRE